MNANLLLIQPDWLRNLLILNLIIASIGFILWYFISSSLRLPIRYQIMFDANPPYVNRIFRRRVFAFFIYTAIPLFIILCTQWIGDLKWSDLQISFEWNRKAALFTLGGVVIAVCMSLMMTPRHSSLEIYPEVRVRFWRPNILVFSAVWWVLYILGYEFFYRGLLLQTFMMVFNDTALSIIASTALYSLSQYFKLNRLSFFSIIYGAVAAYVTLHTGSILPAMISHLTLALSTEWLSIRHHKEMFILNT